MILSMKDGFTILPPRGPLKRFLGNLPAQVSNSIESLVSRVSGPKKSRLRRRETEKPEVHYEAVFGGVPEGPYSLQDARKRYHVLSVASDFSGEDDGVYRVSVMDGNVTRELVGSQ